jgi:hypothetical protein
LFLSYVSWNIHKWPGTWDGSSPAKWPPPKPVIVKQNWCLSKDSGVNLFITRTVSHMNVFSLCCMIYLSPTSEQYAQNDLFPDTRYVPMNLTENSSNRIKNDRPTRIRQMAGQARVLRHDPVMIVTGQSMVDMWPNAHRHRDENLIETGENDCILTSPTTWKCWIPSGPNVEPETAFCIFLCESAVKDSCAKHKMRGCDDMTQDINGFTYPFDYMFLHAFVPEISRCRIPW